MTNHTRRTGRRLATLAASLAGIACLAPVAPAAASCDTAVNCLREQAEAAVAETIATADRVRQDVEARVAETRAELERRATEARQEVESRLSGRSLVCRLEGRWHTSTIVPNPFGGDGRLYYGTGRGPATCVAHDPANPLAGKVQTGTFQFDGRDLTGIYRYPGTAPLGADEQTVLASGSPSPPAPVGHVTLGTDVYRVETVNAAGAYAGVAVTGGAWTAPGTSVPRTFLGAIDLLPAARLDPDGGDDYFIEATIAFQSLT